MSPFAGIGSTSFTPDDLAIGSHVRPRTSKPLLKQGQNTVRGAVLGIVVGAATAAASAGNTGNGTSSAVTVGAGVRPGVYNVRLVAATIFVVEDVGGVFVGRGTTGVAFAGPINFTLTAGGTAFVSGDSFQVTVAKGTKYVLAAAAATDGSDDPVAVLVEDCDATAADTECLIYESGEFNPNRLTFGAGHSAASVKDALGARGIRLMTVLPA